MIHYFYECIQLLHGTYGIPLLCELFEVSRSGYYKWEKRIGMLNSYELRHKEIDGLVSMVYTQYPSSGYRSIRKYIENETGWILTANSVYLSMKRLKIKSLARLKKKTYNNIGNEHDVFPNVLDRNFKAIKPYTRIVTDFTYIRHNSVWYYLVVYLDLFNREVLSWELSTKMHSRFVINGLEKLLTKISKLRSEYLLIHSDQGIQYRSPGYVTRLMDNNIVQSMSRAGNPHDNAAVESFFGHFKDILQYDFNYKKQPNLYEVIEKAVYHYNNDRPAYCLNYKSPIQYKNELSF